MKLVRRVIGLSCLAIVAVCVSSMATAQCVSLTTLGAATAQNFDTLANVGTNVAWTDNSTIPGWYSTRTTYNAGTGSSNTGAMYSFGVTGTNPVTDRALGGVASGGTGTFFWAGCFTNNTGTALTSADITYFGEQWRDGLPVPAAAQSINYEYQVAAPGVITDADTPNTGWTAVAALDFTGPIAGTAAIALDGNLSTNRTLKNGTISVAVPIGSQFWVRWRDINDTSNDHGLAIDDFSLTPQALAANTLTLNDVSINEGNAGTTSFTFTVSLSAPAGAGGVTFDIASANNTAIQPGDYTTNSLTGQTIPAGSSTYSFTVLVNGDTVPETNETFFVNVTNVTGATTTDGQGQGTIVNDDAAPNLTINDISLNEGNAGTTTFTFTVSLSAPAPAGGVTFDIATADNSALQPGDYTQQTLLGQTIPGGSSTYTFDVLVNGETTPELDESFFVNVTNVTNAIATDNQGLGTILNDDITLIHDVQGSGAATPIPGATVTVEGVVVANFQGSTKLQGFFLQEEDTDFDANPQTSEGIFIFCNTCPTAVAEGQRVRAIGVVSEFIGMTEITASLAGSVVVTNAGNNLAQVTPAAIDLPVVGVVDDFYEAREGMKVTFVDTLSVSEYFELGRYGQIVLYEGGRPRQFTEANAPSVAGLTAHLDGLSRREVVLDDDNNAQQWYLTTSAPPGPANGLQYAFHPRANGGFSIGTQGSDFFRGGDLINGLTGVLHWDFPGLGASTWRLRPTSANPVPFTVANPRPATPPNVGGAIKVVGMNLLNYFTTIDTTASNSNGPCGPSGTLDCRGADSVAELNRQRERASVVICTLNADVFGFAELENTTASATITDLLGAVNTRCGGANPYAFVNTGGTLGTDAIRVQQIYRTGIVSPVGAPLSDLDAVHNRPPTAQTFDVVAASNPAFGQRFTVIVNHFKSKGCPGTGGDADALDGQGCFNATRTAQANRLTTWITSTVLPAAGDPDVLLLGDFNAYAKEDPITALTSAGFNDLETNFNGANAYSYLFEGQLGHLDYGFANAALLPQVTGADAWHINADEVPLFDYNDEMRDSPGEAVFEEKPDGSALVPPRVVFQAASPYRASDHDPIVVGLFAIADLAISKTDSPDPVTAGANLIYTITVTNNGPAAAATASWNDTLPAGTTFVSLPAVAGWSCTTPAVGAAGTVACANPSVAVGSAAFTLTVAVSPAAAAGTLLSNTASTSSATADDNPANNSATATTTVATAADLSITKSDAPDPVAPGANLGYTITINNIGPSNAATVALSDSLSAGTTFVSLAAPGGWSCTTPAVGAAGTVSCSIASLASGSAVFTLVVQVGAGVTVGTVISNTATVASATTDPNPGNESATATTTVGTGSADLSVIKVDSTDPVTAGNNLTYTITTTNTGPSAATTATLTDTLPSGTTFVSLVAPGGWSCTTPALGSSGTVSCTNATFAIGSAAFTLVVQVDAAVTAGSVISNTATAASATNDPNPADNNGVATTTVAASADLSVTLADAPDPVSAGANLSYTLTANNAGPSNATSVVLTDTLPAATRFVSLTSPAGWTCTTPAVGASGTVSCSNPSMASGGAVFMLNVTVSPTTLAGTVLSNSVSVNASTNDPNTANNSDSEDTSVVSPSGLSATKSVAGTFSPGATVIYTIAISNAGPAAQGDNTGDEFVDVLPAQLSLISATASAGTALANVGTNTVTWNGAIAAAGSVTITISAQINPLIAAGTNISNQGTIRYDADGNGSNEATGSTDDAALGGPNDATVFVVGVNSVPVPLMGPLLLAALALLLAGLGLMTLRGSLPLAHSRLPTRR